jgi:DNA repair protein RecO (recombination protein O)
MQSPHIYTAEGIILRKRNVRDSDRLLTVLTREHGKIQVLAKGVRKITSRRAGHLEVFCHVRLTIHKGKSYDGISEATSIVRTIAFEDDLTSVTLAYICCELVDKLLPDHQEQQDVFLLLAETLDTVTMHTAHPETLIDEFTTKLLHLLGYLNPTEQLTGQRGVTYVERIIEKKLRAGLLLTRLSAFTTINTKTSR